MLRDQLNGGLRIFRADHAGQGGGVVQRDHQPTEMQAEGDFRHRAGRATDRYQGGRRPGDDDVAGLTQACRDRHQDVWVGGMPFRVRQQSDGQAARLAGAASIW